MDEFLTLDKLAESCELMEAQCPRQEIVLGVGQANEFAIAMLRFQEIMHMSVRADGSLALGDIPILERQYINPGLGVLICGNGVELIFDWRKGSMEFSYFNPAPSHNPAFPRKAMEFFGP